MLIIECTACDDGTRELNSKEIDNGMIIGISVIISIIPSLIKVINRMGKTV